MTPRLAEAMTAAMGSLPGELRRSLAWIRGEDGRARRSPDTGLEIYFGDPYSPWQRGSNENTNGLLRQYFPKKTDLAAHTKEQLDEVAAELNARPRKTLGWRTRPRSWMRSWLASCWNPAAAASPSLTPGKLPRPGPGDTPREETRAAPPASRPLRIACGDDLGPRIPRRSLRPRRAAHTGQAEGLPPPGHGVSGYP